MEFSSILNNTNLTEVADQFMATMTSGIHAIYAEPGNFTVPSAIAVGCLLPAVVYLYKKFSRGTKSEDTVGCALSNIHYFAGAKPDAYNTRRCIELLQMYPHFVNKTLSEHQYLSHGYTPFLRACWNNNFELINFMLNIGADIRLANSDGETAMYLVAYRISKSEEWNPNALNRLWDVGCCVDDVNVHNNSMLHLAAKAGHSTLTRWLLLHGADPTIVNSVGLTPRTLAIRKGSPVHLVVAQLLDNCQDRNQRKFVRRSSGMEVHILERSNTEPIVENIPSM